MRYLVVDVSRVVDISGNGFEAFLFSRNERKQVILRNLPSIVTADRCIVSKSGRDS
jgi:hypothetical protein